MLVFCRSAAFIWKICRVAWVGKESSFYSYSWKCSRIHRLYWWRQGCFCWFAIWHCSSGYSRSDRGCGERKDYSNALPPHFRRQYLLSFAGIKGKRITKNLALDLTDDAALGLVDFSVLPHWGDFPFEETAKQTADVYDGQLKLLKLTNQQAVLVKGDRITIVNNQSV